MVTILAVSTPQSTQRSTPAAGAWRSVFIKIYVAATGWTGGTSPFAATAQRAATDPAWTYREWDTRHNVMHDGPQRVLELLLPLTF